jgi:hypothetical protein
MFRNLTYFYTKQFWKKLITVVLALVTVVGYGWIVFAAAPAGGYSTQNTGAISIGYLSGYNSQGTDSIAIGNNSGYTAQGNTSIAIGVQSGYTSQSVNSLALGYQAGYTSQGTGSIAIGYQSGYTSLGTNSIAIGTNAGMTGVGINCICIGNGANTGTSLPDNSFATITSMATIDGGAPLTYNTFTGLIGVATSSLRYKEDVQPFTSTYSDNVLKLEPVTFKYKKSGVPSIGLIAEEFINIICCKWERNLC